MSRHRSDARRGIAWGELLAQGLGVVVLVFALALIAAGVLILVGAPVLEFVLILIVAVGQAGE